MAETSVDKLTLDISISDTASAKIDELTSKIQNLINQVNVLNGLDINTEKFSKATPQVEQLSGEIDKVTKNTSKLGSTSNTASKMLNKLSISGTKLGKLFSAIKRIVFYRFIRSAIREITQAVSEGINNLYQYSKALNSLDGGTLSANLDRISTSLLYFKNSIGAIAAPIINAVTPAVEALIDRFAELNNKIAAFFAALSGQSVYSAAIKYNKAYADSALKVAAANKAALASFDEINNITISDKSGGASALDYDKMFEEVETPISKLAEKIKAGDWRGVGESLADKLNEQVEKLSSLNIGKKISKKLHNALDLANGFLSKFEFGKFATTILTELFAVLTDETTWAKLGELISNLLIGALDVFDAAVKFITDPNNYKKIGNAFIALFSGTDEGGGIDWKKIFKKITTSLLDLIFNLVTFVGDVRNWKDFGSKFFAGIWSGIKSALSGVWEGIQDWFKKHSFWDLVKSSWDIVGFVKNPLLYVASKLGVTTVFDFVAKSTSKANKSKTAAEQSFMRGYVTGGFQEYGEIYKARENGIPELVGTIGNRPAVANNDQIVQAVSIGVYNAVVDAMTKTSQNQPKQSIIINGREVFSVVQEESQSYTRRTGQSAF